MKLLNKRICIILSIIIVLCCFVSNLYWDEWITQRHGIDFLHFLFKGQISDFYRHCAEETEVAAAYDLTLYVIFAIWNIPCYLYELITKQNSQSLFIFVLWGKSLVLVGYIISILCFKKLYSIVNVNVTGIDASLYYALSPFLLIYCIYTGNYDVLAVVVIMLGIISLFEKRNNMFLLLFSVAISMKYFAVLIFIPIILLKEKKINKIFIELTLGVSLTLIEKIFFSNNFRETRNSAGFAVDLIRKSSTINIIEKTSVFAVFYILICVYCYYKDNMSEEDIKKNIIFLSGMIYVTLFACIDTNSYWIVYIVPFFTIMVLSINKNIFVNICLDLMMNVGWIISMVINKPHIVRHKEYLMLYKFTVLSRIAIYNKIRQLFGLVIETDMAISFLPVINALAIAGTIAILFLYYKYVMRNELAASNLTYFSIGASFRNVISLLIATILIIYCFF